MALALAYCQVKLPQAVKCRQQPYELRPWCRQHSRLERSLHRCYKTISQNLVTWPTAAVTFSAIHDASLEELTQWYDDCRRKLVATRRAIMARHRHHEMFYGGPDYGHGIYIAQLKREETLLEEIMTSLDDKAYSIYVKEADAGWLADLNAVRVHHQTCESHCDSDEEEEEAHYGPWRQVNSIQLADYSQGPPTLSSGYAELDEPPPSAVPELVADQSSASSSEGEEEEEDVELDAEEEAELEEILKPTRVKDPSLCECCQHLEFIEAPETTYQQRLLHYYAYSALFSAHAQAVAQSQAKEIAGTASDAAESDVKTAGEQGCREAEKGAVNEDVCTAATADANTISTVDLDLGVSPNGTIDPNEEVFAETTISNLFREVIARIPALLVRAKTSGHTQVRAFLESDCLSEEDHARLWRAMKQKDGQQEGKITPEVIRSALVDAEFSMSEEGEAPGRTRCVELLGGKVWKDPHDGPMTTRCWNHLYNFVFCACCAEGVVRTFDEWEAFQRNAVASGEHRQWIEEGQLPGEDVFRTAGLVFYWHDRDGSLKLEHVKPAMKGVKSVYVETEQRNVCYLRLNTDNPMIDKLKSLERKTIEKAQVELLQWAPEKRKDPSIRHKSSSSIWTTLLRSGMSLKERKSARWTITQNFRCSNCVHRHLLTHAPARLPKQAESYDVCVIDTAPAKDQTPERTLARLQALLGLQEGEKEKEETFRCGKCKINHPKKNMRASAPVAWKLARSMFRENAHYKGVGRS